MDVPKQEIITRDNVSVMVDAVVFFQVVSAEYAVTKVENWVRATSLQAQTTLRSVIGQAELDELLSERDKINLKLQAIIDEMTEPWGIKVTSVEVRDVTLPESMKRAMANQAETERERRSKIINAEGEFQAAQKITEAADIISRNPQALAASIPANAARDRRGAQHYHHLPDADRPDRAVAEYREGI